MVMVMVIVMSMVMVILMSMVMVVVTMTMTTMMAMRIVMAVVMIRHKSVKTQLSHYFPCAYVPHGRGAPRCVCYFARGAGQRRVLSLYLGLLQP